MTPETNNKGEIVLLADVNDQLSANNSTRLIWGDAQHEQKKSRAGSRNNTTDIWCSKKLQFWRNLEEVLN